MLIMPLFHIHGMVAAFLTPLSAGGVVIIPPRLSPSFWQDFESHRATWFTATPTMHQILLSFAPPEKLPYIRFIRSCSSPLALKTKEKLESLFCAPVLQAYAMREASHQISSNSLPPATRPPGSCGTVQGDIEMRIVDVNGTPVAAGTEGEICVRGPTVMGEYHHNPEANASAFTHDGFFLTGDYGKQDRSGFLTLTGRIKDFINKGGEKNIPMELDDIMIGHPLVAEAVSCAIEDDMFGQDVGMAVRVIDGSVTTVKDLQRWMRERVAPHKVPKKVSMNHIVDGFNDRVSDGLEVQADVPM